MSCSISPSGQQAVLMAHVGGPYSVTNLVLAFDDAATNSLTDAILVSGTNHATLDPAAGLLPRPFPASPPTPI